jgi:glycosyl transferase family 87
VIAEIVAGIPQRRRRALLIVAAASLAAIAAASVGDTLYRNRLRYEHADFDLYYHWWLEYRVGIDPWRPDVIPAGAPSIRTIWYCNYAPPFVILLSPLSRIEVQACYWIWLALQIAALATAIVLLLRQLRPPPGAPATVAIVALAMLFPQVHATLYEAQFTFLLLLILSAAWILDRIGRTGLAGLMLAIAALLKIYPAAIGGYFLFRGRFRTLVWAALATVAGVLATGIGRWHEYLFVGVPSFDTPHWLAQPRAVAIWCNVYAAMRSLQGGVAPNAFGFAAVGITAVLDLIVVAGAAAVTLKTPREYGTEIDGVCFGLWMVVALLISPVTWLHELVLLFPLYLFAAASLAKGFSPDTKSAAMLAIGLAGFVVTYFWVPAREFRMYFILAVLTYIAGCTLANSLGAARRAT